MAKYNQGVAGVIFSQDGSGVLLIKRMDVPVWVLPGGGVEPGESLTQAVTRELLEETGFHVEIKRKVGEFHPKNKLTQLTHLYECTIIGGCAMTGDETADIQYFPLSSLPKLMPPPYQEWIADALLYADKPLIKTTHSVTYLALMQTTLKHPLLVLKYFFNKWKRSLLSD